MNLRKKDFIEHGYTVDGCARCDWAIRYGWEAPTTLSHSQECRCRLREAIRASGDAGRRRVEEHELRRERAQRMLSEGPVRAGEGADEADQGHLNFEDFQSGAFEQHQEEAVEDGIPEAPGRDERRGDETPVPLEFENGYKVPVSPATDPDYSPTPPAEAGDEAMEAAAVQLEAIPAPIHLRHRVDEDEAVAYADEEIIISEDAALRARARKVSKELMRAYLKLDGIVKEACEPEEASGEVKNIQAEKGQTNPNKVQTNQTTQICSD